MRGGLTLYLKIVLSAFVKEPNNSYKEGLQRMGSTSTKKNLNGLFVYPLSYDKVGCV